MGIPRLLEHLGTGERVALSKLAIEHIEKTNRPLRIAIDAAIWNFQAQSGQGGKNPALRTLFFRLLRLLALPIQPVFVYDGKNKPLTKRGRTVSGYGRNAANELSIGLVKQFKFPWHIAPGEAEAECALLQKRGIVDMVMSQDVDAIMFGAGVTLRDWSKEGTRGNKAPTHVNVMELKRLTESSGLDCDGMILVALLSGGDYDEAGVSGFGIALACEVAKAGFGKDLIELVKQKDWDGLREWRERLNFELETNESGYFKRKNKKIKVPDHFPDLEILSYYLEPAVSADRELSLLEAKLVQSWKSEIDVQEFRNYTATMFDWCWKSGARRFIRCFAQPLFQSRLTRGTINTAAFSIESITERRQHFVNDGIPELRLYAIPADVVGLDIAAEQDNPEYTAEGVEEEEEVLMNAGDIATVDGIEGELAASSNAAKRKPQPWDPYMPEKWWVPETLLQLGMPEIVEDWHQLQRDIRADPQRFATRKTAKTIKTNKRIDAGMKAGALRGFLTNVSKQTKSRAAQEKGSAKTKSTVRGDTLSLSKNSVEIEAQFNIESTCEDNVQSNLSPFQRSEDVSSAPKHALWSVNESPNGLPRNGKLQRAGNKYIVDDEEEMPVAGSSPGTSFNTGLLIESSPVPAMPPNSTEPFLAQEELHGVTQRRQRRTRARPRKVPSPPASPSRTRRPIESFFTQTKEAFTTDNRQRSSSLKLAKNEVSSKVLTGVPSGTRSTALARDSLPGTWKELDASSIPDKRVPRVSCVDLTTD